MCFCVSVGSYTHVCVCVRGRVGGWASALALIEACALSALVKWSSQLNDLAGSSRSSVACITITLLAPYKHNDYYNRDRVRGRQSDDRD